MCSSDLPGLDDIGRAQAAETAERLAAMAPMPIVSSPLRRCRETAQALTSLWPGVDVVVAEEVREIPSPPGIPMGRRVEWLRAAMAGTWRELGSPFVEFRDGVVRYVAARSVPTVVFSHFIAINAVIGACIDDDRLVIDSLDNASVTIVEADGAGGLRLVERGRQADTLIR